MTETIVDLQPAYILQQQKYRETSLIIDVFTRDFGRVSLLAKGVRKAKSKTAGLLQPFIPLTISYFGKAELKILRSAETAPPYPELAGLPLYCGFYLNELIRNFLHKHDPHPEVFAEYQACLGKLAVSETQEALLRIFELNLLNHIGYGLPLEYDFQTEQPISPKKHYHFASDSGFYEAEQGSYPGAALLAVKNHEFTDPIVLSAAKRLLRTVIDGHLQGKTLNSRIVINQIIKAKHHD